MTSCESDLITDTIRSLQMKTALQKIRPRDGEELSLDAITLAPGSRGAAVLCLVTQSCQTLCNSMDCSPPGSSVRGDSAGKNTGVGCHVLLQGIFPTTGLNPGIPHCRQILYHLSHQSDPQILEWAAYSFCRGIGQQGNPLLTQGLNWGLLNCRWIAHQLSYQGSPGQEVLEV